MLGLKRRKILVSAYGCEPFRGSEAGVGWNWVLQMAQYNDLWVIARLNDKEKIEKNIPKSLQNSLHFYYYDTCNLLKKVKHKEKGLYLYYWFWQIGIIKIIRKLIKEEKFDYSMHLSFGSLWMPTFLPFFKIPFIWGPLGGADGIPKKYLRKMPIKQRIVQSFRYVLIKTAWINPLVVIPSRAAVAILGRTPNNIEAIPKKYRHKGHVILETAMDDNALFELSEIEKKSEKIEIISTGRLVPFKNITMAVECIKKILEDGYFVHYTIIGKGPEKERIFKLIQKYNLEKNITLTGEMPREMVLKQLRKADIYLFPSLREGGSWALMEAMAAALPTVCFNWTGTGIITDSSCAIRIEPNKFDEDNILFVKGIEELIDNNKKRKEYGKKARERICKVYNWKEKGLFMNKLFQKLEGDIYE